jgi:hypothetical protein
MRFSPLDVHHETDAARIVFGLGIVQALLGRIPDVYPIVHVVLTHHRHLPIPTVTSFALLRETGESRNHFYAEKVK